jgi:hypothetical protein
VIEHEDLEDEQEDYPAAIGPFHQGVLFVLDDKCSTCIFRPGNLMHLNQGRVKDMVERCVRDQGVIPCHKTLAERRAVCRGFWDGYRRHIGLLQIAERLDIVRYVSWEEQSR